MTDLSLVHQLFVCWVLTQHTRLLECRHIEIMVMFSAICRYVFSNVGSELNLKIAHHL